MKHKSIAKQLPMAIMTVCGSMLVFICLIGWGMHRELIPETAGESTLNILLNTTVFVMSYVTAKGAPKRRMIAAVSVSIGVLFVLLMCKVFCFGKRELLFTWADALPIVVSAFAALCASGKKEHRR